MLDKKYSKKIEKMRISPELPALTLRVAVLWINDLPLMKPLDGKMRLYRGPTQQLQAAETS